MVDLPAILKIAEFEEIGERVAAAKSDQASLESSKFIPDGDKDHLRPWIG